MSPFKVIIVGGGLSGLLLANGLVRNHVDVAVYERDPEITERAGYQIRLGEYSLRAFRACLEPALITAIEQKFGLSSAATTQSPYTAPSLYSTKFKPILDLGKMPTYTVSTAINRVVLRNFLIGPVKEHGSINFDKTFTHYEIVQSAGGQEKVRVHFADNTSDTCDVLIGADGSASKQVGLNNLVHIDSQWVFVCKGSLPLERVQKLPKRYQLGPTLTFHNQSRLYYALYLPSKKVRGEDNNVLFNYDEGEASFYWAFDIPKAGSKYEHSEQIPDNLQFCLDHVKDWAPEYQTMLSIGLTDGENAPVSIIPLRASKKPSKHWRDNLLQNPAKADAFEGHPRVWMMGDAVHAMQPNRGMGGNQAMYDCVDILPELVGLNELARTKNGVSTKDIEFAVKRFENKMLDRAFEWVEKSGGTNVPKVNFNGIMGYLLSMFNSFILPLIALAFRLLRKVTG